MEVNNWELASAIQYFRKLVVIFHQNNLAKLATMSFFVNIASQIIKLSMKPTNPPTLLSTQLKPSNKSIVNFLKIKLASGLKKIKLKLFYFGFQKISTDDVYISYV